MFARLHKLLLLSILSDLYRYSGDKKIKYFFKVYYTSPGFKFLVWYRIMNYLKNNNTILYYAFWFKFKRIQYRFGFDIPADCNISQGFYIGHFGGIVISPRAIIGKNCNISQNVTIGYSSRGKNIGYPIIGERVYIGPGAVIIGNIKIGNDVAIGANSVVLNDVPKNSVVAGIPAKIVSNNGSVGYIKNIL